MQHECKITVLETKCFPDLQQQYLANPESGPCPFFKPGDIFLLKRTPQQDWKASKIGRLITDDDVGELQSCHVEGLAGGHAGNQLLP